MKHISSACLILLSIALALVIQLFIVNSVMAQAPNTTSAEKHNTTRIVDLKKHTITIVDAKTNETKSVKNYTPTTAGNTTINKISPTNTQNSTINETSPTNTQNSTINETSPTNTQNTTSTTFENLTTRLNALKGK